MHAWICSRFQSPDRLNGSAWRWCENGDCMHGWICSRFRAVDCLVGSVYTWCEKDGCGHGSISYDALFQCDVHGSTC